MLGSDRAAPLAVDVAIELRDALSRRQKELPPRWLAAVDASTRAEGATISPGHALDITERELGLALLRNHLGDARPRGIVCVRPGMSSVYISRVESLRERGSVVSIAAAELDATLAREALERIAGPDARQASVALVCDCAVELPLPDTFPRPRVYLCLGNVLGSTTTVGAVRILRVLRTTMTPADSIVLGLDVRHTGSANAGDDDDPETVTPARHLAALDRVNASTGATFDLDRFDYQSRFDRDNRRVETHLVARRALALEVPGVCNVRLRKGESIRTSVRCLFDRARVAAMVGGVGLALRQWTTDPDDTYVVALATPAV
jgi:L-histidine N-alpha-methyltransferase